MPRIYVATEQCELSTTSDLQRALKGHAQSAPRYHHLRLPSASARSPISRCQASMRVTSIEEHGAVSCRHMLSQVQDEVRAGCSWLVPRSAPGASVVPDPCQRTAESPRADASGAGGPNRVRVLGLRSPARVRANERFGRRRGPAGISRVAIAKVLIGAESLAGGLRTTRAVEICTRCGQGQSPERTPAGVPRGLPLAVTSET